MFAKKIEEKSHIRTTKNTHQMYRTYLKEKKNVYRPTKLVKKDTVLWKISVFNNLV